MDTQATLERFGFVMVEGLSEEHRAEVGALYGDEFDAQTGGVLLARESETGDDGVTQYANTDGWLLTCPIQGQPSLLSAGEFDHWLQSQE